MATIVPVDEFVTDEWYPGFKPAFEHAPYYVEPFRTFTKEDEKRFWFLDFHWPRGLTPLGLIWNEDGYNWGTQFAAENLPLPPGRGLVVLPGDVGHAGDGWSAAERGVWPVMVVDVDPSGQGGAAG